MESDEVGSATREWSSTRAGRRRRIGAYGVCRDDASRVLLVRASPRSARPGTWFLPGGGIDHGEHPADAVVREVAEETGLAVEVVRVREVAAELVVRPHYLEHTDGVIYDLAVTGGGLRAEVDGSSDLARWVPHTELGGLPISRFAAGSLGLPFPPPDLLPDLPATGSRPGPQRRPPRGQRFGAYGLVTDPADRVLLTLIADGYPGAGRWHPPGGGTDFGEQPAEGLLREITEESDQAGRITGLITVSSHHNRSALGPEGRPLDWHSVRAVFRVAVDRPTAPRVLDAGGSTAEAAWLTRTEAAAVPLTDVAAQVLAA